MCEHTFVRWDNLTIEAERRTPPAAGLPRRGGRAPLRRPRGARHPLLRGPRRSPRSTACRVRAGCRSAGRSTRTGAAAMPARTASPARRTTTSTSTPGRDFEREIVVKVNVPEVLARASCGGRPGRGEHVALGTNTDPYQWVEGRYRADARRSGRRCATPRNPCSVLTKSPLRAARPRPAQADRRSGTSQRVPVGPDARREGLAGERAAHAAPAGAAGGGGRAQPRPGIPTGVLIAPLMPGINDDPAQVEEILALARGGGRHARSAASALHLRGGDARRVHGLAARPAPGPRGALRGLYARGAYLPAGRAAAPGARCARGARARSGRDRPAASRRSSAPQPPLAACAQKALF